MEPVLSEAIPPPSTRSADAPRTKHTVSPEAAPETERAVAAATLAAAHELGCGSRACRGYRGH